MKFTLFVIIFSYLPADVALNGEAGFRHTYSVPLAEFNTIEECNAAELWVKEKNIVLTYPNSVPSSTICVEGAWR